MRRCATQTAALGEAAPPDLVWEGVTPGGAPRALTSAHFQVSDRMCAPAVAP